MNTPARPSTQGEPEFPLQPIEVVSVLGAIGLVLTHVALFARMPEFWHWTTPVVIVLGLLGADFFAAVLHWAGDTWGTEHTPWVGRRFLHPFRYHHARPLEMLKSNFFTTNGDTALSALPFLLVPFLIPLGTAGGRITALFFAAVGGWGMWTSQFHQWAHMKSPPRVVAWLQRRGAILSREHHRKHHKAPFATNYGITTGWCDGFLNAIRFFQTLEWSVTKLTGCEPRSESVPIATERPRGTNQQEVS
ncbi:sterol desaturase family protein [Gemmata sp. G18]|uniref:Sterol desaturase family protein n=1 Tax=Gemmata palustris TaxID=2822762 RepID=A0ABS5BM15_9BACT|nr:fatty acid desaturase CarF family protein [Gemmata palustris]MBP3954731.1 sterol desaturase family protein [Gemmata palustris]